MAGERVKTELKKSLKGSMGRRASASGVVDFDEMMKSVTKGEEIKKESAKLGIDTQPSRSASQ